MPQHPPLHFVKRDTSPSCAPSVSSTNTSSAPRQAEDTHEWCDDNHVALGTSLAVWCCCFHPHQGLHKHSPHPSPPTHYRLRTSSDVCGNKIPSLDTEGAGPGALHRDHGCLSATIAIPSTPTMAGASEAGKHWDWAVFIGTPGGYGWSCGHLHHVITSDRRLPTKCEFVFFLRKTCCGTGHSTTQHNSTIQHNITQHNTTQYNTTQYNTT